MATFWISEFIDSDVDRWKVQLCTQLRTPTMRRWRRSFWRLFLHMKCHRYDVVGILIINVCQLIQMDHDTRERCGGYCTKRFLVQDSKNPWEFDKETCGANPEALLLGDTVPLYLAVSWWCLATLRVEDANDFTVTALTFGPLPPIRHMCCDKMWMWVDLFAKLIRNIALCLCFVEIWNGVQI